MSLSTRTAGVMVFALLAAVAGAGAFLGSTVASNLTEPGERVVLLEDPQGFAQTPAWAKRSAGGFTGFGGLPALPGVVLHSGTISESSDGGRRTAASDFALLLDGQPVVQGEANTVSAGAHTVGEQPLAGYALSAVSCVDGQGARVRVNGDTVVLAPGQSVICTLTNDDVEAGLTLKTVVVNDDGGRAQSDDFTLLLDGWPVVSGVGQAVSAGAHTVGEQPADGYVMTAVSCVDGRGTTVPVNGDTVDVALGRSVTCTFTNEDVAPSITLVKAVVNGGGGQAAAGDFTLLLDGQPVVQGAANAVGVGAHTVGEQPLDGYVLSTVSCVDGQGSTVLVSGGAVALALDQHVTCTLTNDDVDARLTLKTVVVNDDGGWARAGDFALLLDEQPVASGVGQAVSAGAHTVSEQPADGYVMTAVSCVDGQGTTVPVNGDAVDVALGQHVTCTFTSDDVAPSITLTKAVVGSLTVDISTGAWLISIRSPDTMN